MNLKIVFGVAVPAVIIVILTVLASLNIGFTVQESYVKKLTIQDMFSGQGLKSSIALGTIRISNDYFLPKRYEASDKIACLVDDQGVKQPQDVGSLSYSEGDAGTGYYDSYPLSGAGRETSIEVGAHQNKNVQIYLNPQNIYAYSYDNNKTQQELILENYGDYDALVLIDKKNLNDVYASCYSVTTSQIDSGKRIALK